MDEASSEARGKEYDGGGEGGCTRDKQRFTSVSVATSPNSSRVLGMNIHGARSLARSLPPSFPSQPIVVPVDSPTLSLASSSLRVSLRTAPRPICHPLRYPSNGYRSKAEITIRVCPVDEVDSGRENRAKANRTREREGGSDAYEGRGTSQWSLPLNWKLRFRPVKCRFSSPPY